MPDSAPPRPEVAAAAGRIWEVVQPSKRLTAVTHKDADGDTLGSALGLALALGAGGRQVAVVSSPPVPRAWEFLPGFQLVNRDPPVKGSPVFILDSTDETRAGDYLELVRRAPTVINIDHHVSNTQFGTINLVDAEAAATGELVYELLKAWDLPIPATAAGCLYAAILSDTGGFRHDNTSEHALRSATELVGLGADPAAIARGLFKSRPASTLRMQGRILHGLHFECGDRLIWGSITRDVLEEVGASADQADGAIDQLNTVAGQEIAILFKEAGPSLTKVSIRTRDRVDAAALAALFGGGGHRRASGIEMRLSLREAERAVLEAARTRIEGCTGS
jgi:phosphoesterase RecJ-like protein